MDRSVNPAEEGFDLAISGHAASSYEGVIDVPLYPFEQVLCASPEYLERRGDAANAARPRRSRRPVLQTSRHRVAISK